VTIEVTDAAARERFEARDSGAGAVLGFMTYQLSGNIVAFTHTEVFRGIDQLRLENKSDMNRMDSKLDDLRGGMDDIKNLMIQNQDR
jgi:hypothetical protein